MASHYFSPDTKPEDITEYFRILENILVTNNFCVVLLEDFSAPGFNWEMGPHLPNCHVYSNVKGDAIYTFTCRLGRRQCIETVHKLNLLELVFANFTDLKSVPDDSHLVKPDIYHPPFSIDVYLPHDNNNIN
jgi:hypothetical protein